MTKGTKRALIGALAAATVMAGLVGTSTAQPSSAQARVASQLDLSGRRGNFDAVQLRTGFMPDPKRVNGRSGGAIDADGLGATCGGWIARRPDHVLTLRSTMDFFRVFTTSEADVTLVIRTPDGQWLCDDDGGEGLNARIDKTGWARGRYLVWVGSYESGVVAPYSLAFTELASVTE